MNVYDFDKTIYDGDSTLDFYFYCIQRQPMILMWLPSQIWAFALCFFGVIDKTKFKQCFYIFLKSLKNIDDLIILFWGMNEKKIKEWYIKRQQFDDVVISASPEFLLKPICDKFQIQYLIASRVDKQNGKYYGLNCYGEEKVSRFKEVFPNNSISEFYSDSLSDAPLAILAKKSYIVQKNNVVAWGEYKHSTIQKCKNTFFTKEFVLFLFIGVLNTVNGVLFAFLYSIFTNANLAFVLGYITSLAISYLLNSFITFKERITFGKYLKFCVSYIPNFIIQNIMVVVFYNFLNWDKLLVYTLAAVIGVPITFIMIKFFAFDNKGSKN